MSLATSPSAAPFRPLQLLPALTVLLVLSVVSLQSLLQPVVPLQRLPLAEAEMPRAPLPHLGKVAAFSLTERSGQTTTQAQLAGKVWIADFIFTSCHMECPLMSAEMQKLQDQLRHRDLRLVSFSVDPATDTPARLREYAAKYRADAERWLFLTGAQAELYKLAGDSFKLAVAEQKPTGGSGPFLHSQKFVLVDAELGIRGYYDSTDPAALRKLLDKDLPQLLP